MSRVKIPFVSNYSVVDRSNSSYFIRGFFATLLFALIALPLGQFVASVVGAVLTAAFWLFLVLAFGCVSLAVSLELTGIIAKDEDGSDE